MIQRVLEGRREELPGQLHGQELRIGVDIPITGHGGLDSVWSTAQIRGTALRTHLAGSGRGAHLLLQLR